MIGDELSHEGDLPGLHRQHAQLRRRVELAGERDHARGHDLVVVGLHALAAPRHTVGVEAVHHVADLERRLLQQLAGVVLPDDAGELVGRVLALMQRLPVGAEDAQVVVGEIVVHAPNLPRQVVAVGVLLTRRPRDGVIAAALGVDQRLLDGEVGPVLGLADPWAGLDLATAKIAQLVLAHIGSIERVVGFGHDAAVGHKLLILIEKGLQLSPPVRLYRGCLAKRKAACLLGQLGASGKASGAGDLVLALPQGDAGLIPTGLGCRLIGLDPLPQLRVFEPLVAPGLTPVGLDLLDVQDALAIGGEALLGAQVGDDVGLGPVGGGVAGLAGPLLKGEFRLTAGVLAADPFEMVFCCLARVEGRAPEQRFPVQHQIIAAALRVRRRQQRLGVIAASLAAVLGVLWLLDPVPNLHPAPLSLVGALERILYRLRHVRVGGVEAAHQTVLGSEIEVLVVRLDGLLLGHAQLGAAAPRLLQRDAVLLKELDQLVLGHLAVGVGLEDVLEPGRLQLGGLDALALQRRVELLHRRLGLLQALRLLQRLGVEAELVEQAARDAAGARLGRAGVEDGGGRADSLGDLAGRAQRRHAHLQGVARGDALAEVESAHDRREGSEVARQRLEVVDGLGGGGERPGGIVGGRAEILLADQAALDGDRDARLLRGVRHRLNVGVLARNLVELAQIRLDFSLGHGSPM